MSEKEIYQAAIDTFGADNQMDRMVEECSEVIGAIMKYKKHKNEGWGDLEADVKHIEDELGDLKNVFKQMEIIFNRENIAANATAKLLRLKGRIATHKPKKYFSDDFQKSIDAIDSIFDAHERMKGGGISE